MVRLIVLHAGPYIRKSLENTQGSLQSGMPGSNSETRACFCEGWSSNIMLQYSVDPTITLHGRIAAREKVDSLGNQVYEYLMIQTLFPSNDAVFQDDNAPTHTARTVQSWFEKHEGELQHLPWPARSPHLNNTEPLWSVLETRARNRFPPPTSLKQPEDVLQGESYKISLHCSKLVRVRSKKDCSCTEGKRWSNTILIKKCVCVFFLE
jgi:hypothetical protein